MARMWPALAATVLVAAGLAGGAGAWAAEPAATASTKSDAIVVLDSNSIWRLFVVSRCAFARTTDGKLVSQGQTCTMDIDRKRREVQCTGNATAMEIEVFWSEVSRYAERERGANRVFRKAGLPAVS